PHPIQTQQPQGQQRPFSPGHYQHSPSAMSPNMSGIPPAKKQRLSPNPPSPYGQPYSTPSYSPYSANSPPGAQYLSLPPSPAAAHPSQSFNQPQPYQPPSDPNSRPPQGSMLPPRIPYSKAQDTDQLEKANPRDNDDISDVLTGSGIDLKAEEEALSLSYRNVGTSFNASQGSRSTVSPHGSFNNWSQAGTHGAFQGSGPLSQAITQEEQEAELVRKHTEAARALAETSQAPLSDPFLHAVTLRHTLAKRAYDNSVQVNLDGLFDKIPDVPQNVSRTALNGPNGESIVKLQADSLLTQGAPLVDILSLVSLAAEDRIRTILEDAFTLAQGRRTTSHGVVPPNLADLARAGEGTQTARAVPTNISKTAWEAPESAVSPMTVTASKHPSAGRLPTPPTDAPPTPQATVAFPNHVAAALKRRAEEDYKFEEARIAKRQKRLQGNAATPAETPAVAPVALPTEASVKAAKKQQDRQNKLNQTDEVLHRKANETASMALGMGKKKYSWLTGGGGGGSG
ncbi:hypothetical protein K491DRAFT_565558, partial [Lophiostoma macrostomum CBS 122681]